MEGETVKTACWLVFPMALFSLSGCALLGVSQGPVQAQAEEQKSYYCQGGSNRAEWYCEEIASTGDPRQIPAVQNVPVTAPAPVAVAPSPVQVTPLQATPQPTQRPGPAPAPTPAPASGSMPLYMQLAYVPEGETRLEDLPGHFYAVQLAAFSERYKVEEWAETTGLEGLIGARIMANGKLFYVLILGVYETRVRAERAVQSIEGIPTETEPWIRSVASLRPAIREANRALN